ncbi:hypothetical protein [Candidatus Enterovibrio escicola]|nr:hypothetical protein [Candidatus Enterovibrio escacola]
MTLNLYLTIMRYTCATCLVMNDTPKLKILLWLGRSMTCMVKCYSHLNVKHFADAVTFLEGYLSTA